MEELRGRLLVRERTQANLARVPRAFIYSLEIFAKSTHRQPIGQGIDE